MNELLLVNIISINHASTPITSSDKDNEMIKQNTTLNELTQTKLRITDNVRTKT